MGDQDPAATVDLQEQRALREAQAKLEQRRRELPPREAPAPPAPTPALQQAAAPAVLGRVRHLHALQLQTPDGAARSAEGARRDTAQRRERETESFSRPLAIVRARGIPEHADMLRVAFAAVAPSTIALDAVLQAQQWSEAQGRYGIGAPYLVVLVGPAGTGKTAALLRAIYREPKGRVSPPALFVPATAIGACPRTSYSTSEEQWQRWLTVPLLAIDELGAERGDPVGIAALLHERHTHGRRTLASCNLSADEFADRYVDGRLADRLGGAQEGRGLPAVVVCDGVSLRDPAASAALWATVER